MDSTNNSTGRSRLMRAAACATLMIAGLFSAGGALAQTNPAAQAIPYYQDFTALTAASKTAAHSR